MIKCMTDEGVQVTKVFEKREMCENWGVNHLYTEWVKTLDT